jgi:hypothetical protein
MSTVVPKAKIRVLGKATSEKVGCFRLGFGRVSRELLVSFYPSNIPVDSEKSQITSEMSEFKR